MSWKVVDSDKIEIERRSEPWCTDAMKATWTEKLLPRYETSHGALMPILHDVQHAYRHVSYQAMIEIASFLAIPPAEVLDTVSFYEEYTTEPVGKCVIGICQSIACEVCGHQAIVDRIRERLDLEPHETDDEGRYTLLLLECLGSCDTAPVALFNEELAEHLMISQVDAILDEIDAVPIESLDRKMVQGIVRSHSVTQSGREAGADDRGSDLT